MTKAQKRLVRQFSDLIDWGESQLRDAPLPDEPALNLLGQFTRGVHKVARAIRAVVDGGSTDALDVLVRTLVETWITARYLLAEPRDVRVATFLVDTLRLQRTLVSGEMLLQKKGKWPVSSVDELEALLQRETNLTNEINKHVARHGEVVLKWPSVEIRAKDADLEATYLTAYRLASQGTHMSVLGMGRFVRQEDDASYFNLGQNLSQFETILRTAYCVYVALLTDLSIHTGHPLPEALLPFQGKRSGG